MNKYIQTLSRKAILITLLRLIKAVLIKLKSVVLSPLSKHVARKVQEAEELMEQEEWEEAAQKWQELTIRPRLKQVPAAAWTKGGRAYRYQLLFAEADEILSRGINIHPENIGLKMEFAEVAVDRQDWHEAVKRWQEVIDTSIEDVPSNVWAKLIRALRYDSVAKQKQAESVAKQNLEVHQNSPTIATEFAYAAVDKQDWPEAVRRWRYVVSIYEEDTPISVWINLSKSLRFSSQQEEAEDIIRNATELYPEAIELRLELAEVLISQQKWSEALSVVEAVLKDVEPYSPDFERFGQYRMAASALKRLIDIDSYKQKVESYKQAVATRDGNLPKIAIYTAVSRNYDSLKLPEVLDARFDYIVFSDTPIADTGVFKVRPMPYLHQDPTRSARFIKTHPHLLLEDYDLAIWVDANIMILDDIYPIINEFIASRKPLAAIEHPLRQSVYEEADACIDINKDKADIIREQIDYYEDLGLPGQDLIESNFMVFDLKNKKLPDMFNTWWSQIDIFSKRDQLSFPFVINKHSIKYHHLTKRPSSIRDHPSFALIPHAANNVPNKLVELLSESQINPYNDQSFSAVKESRVSHQKDRRIDVVVCVHNALDDVKLCLEAIKKHLSNNMKLIIVNDGSDSVTSDFLDGFTNKNKNWVKIISHKKALGYSKAANKGLKASDGELVVLVNSDVVVTKDWAHKLADVAFSIAGVGIVGPMSSAASYQSIPSIKWGEGVQTATNSLRGLSAEDLNRKCEEWSSANLFPLVPLVHGSCFGITREVIDTIGYFDDDSFPRGYGEETDYCFRAANAGFLLAIATNTYVFHAKSRSYKEGERTKLMREGSQKVRQLHGYRRFYRSGQAMKTNPLLESIRSKCKRLYLETTSHTDTVKTHTTNKERP